MYSSNWITQVIIYILLSLIALIFKVKCISTDRIPVITCPNIFQYVRTEDGNAGQITLHDLPLATIKVTAHFAQRESIPNDSKYQLSLSQDLPTTKDNIVSNLPVLYHVQFPNPNVLPKLTKIVVNDKILCSNTGLPPPSSTFSVYHTFYPSKNQINEPLPDEDYTQHINSNEESNIFSYNKPFQQPNPPSTPISIECGLESAGLTPLMVGGTNFHRGKFPWLTAIYLRRNADMRFTCGGTLISLRTVITAAHCFLDSSITEEHIVVFLGRHNLYATEPGAEQRDIQRLITHPQFNLSALSDADIAILQLKTSVSISQFIRPICLWTQATELNFIVGQIGFVAGWGADNQGNIISQLPKLTEAKIVSEAECLRSSEMFRQTTSERTLCAGNRDGNGPCLGDSGGSLMINIFGVWTLRGIISVGQMTNGLCNLREFVVYSDVAKHITWVRDNVIS